MRGRDEGFTVVEVLVAMVIILVVATASMSALLSTEKNLGAARQRQWASSLATQAIEQLRALPYTTLTAGLRSADIGTDPFVTASGGSYTLSIPRTVSGSAADISEPLQTSGTSSTPAPLNPHVATPATTAPSTFAVPPTVSVYVTTNTADAGAYTLTAVVRWTPNGGTQRVLVQRSRLYSPSGSGGAP